VISWFLLEYLGRREHVRSDVSKATPGIDMHRVIRQAYTNGAGSGTEILGRYPPDPIRRDFSVTQN